VSLSLYVLGPEKRSGAIQVAWTPAEARKLEEAAKRRSELYDIVRREPFHGKTTFPPERAWAIGEPSDALVIVAPADCSSLAEATEQTGKVYVVHGTDVRLFKQGADDAYLEGMPKSRMPYLFQNRFLKPDSAITERINANGLVVTTPVKGIEARAFLSKQTIARLGHSYR